MKKKGWREALFPLVMLAGVALLFVLVSAGTLPVLAEPEYSGGDPDSTNRRERPPGDFSAPLTMLLMGVATWGNESLVDVVILLYFDPQSGECAALSIPRDTIVFAPEWGWCKLSQSYFKGGREMTRATVEHFTGVPVDYYVELNFDSVERIVDTLGGITFDVDRYISHDGISIPPGTQHLTGREALILLRFRNEPGGDIARVARQQRFILTFLERLRQEENKRNLAALLPVFYRHVETDVPLREVLDFYFAFRSLDNLERIRFATVPGDHYQWDTQSCWRADLAATETLLKDLFGPLYGGMGFTRYSVLEQYERQLEWEKEQKEREEAMEEELEPAE